MTENSGYIYVPNWDELQHYSDRRPSWIKLYIDLLDNDDFLDLTFAQRAVLMQIWILCARVGNGRLQAGSRTLLRHLQPTNKGDASHLPRTLERLSEAGFIEVRASKSLAIRYQRASPDLREEKEKKKERAMASAVNGAPRAEEDEEPPMTKEEMRAAIAAIRPQLGAP